jgi:hypothetical protein
LAIVRSSIFHSIPRRRHQISTVVFSATHPHLDGYLLVGKRVPSEKATFVIVT